MVAAGGGRLRHRRIGIRKSYGRHSALGRASQGLALDIRSGRCIVWVSDIVHFFFRLPCNLGRLKKHMLAEVETQLGRLLLFGRLQDHGLLVRHLLLLIYFHALSTNSCILDISERLVSFLNATLIRIVILLLRRTCQITINRTGNLR